MSLPLGLLLVLLVAATTMLAGQIGPQDATVPPRTVSTTTSTPTPTPGASPAAGQDVP